jgi:L-threonylcarbamoyladenylate synthase
MRILKINPNRPEKEKLLEASKIIKQGGVVVYPTETVYGLGVNAFDKKAVEKVFAIKSREKLKPISIAVKNLTEAEKLAEFNTLALKISKKFLPGPLTIVLPLKDKRLEIVSAGTKTVGIRIPDYPLTTEFLECIGVPITATSANMTEMEEPLTAQDAMNQIGDKVDLILDAGKCKLSVPSTIVSVMNEEIKIIRKGYIPEEEIFKIK